MRLTMKQLLEYIENLEARIEKIERKGKYKQWTKTCPCCGKITTRDPYVRYSNGICYDKPCGNCWSE